MSSLRAITLICMLCVLVSESAVLIADNLMHRMIELNSKQPFCKSHVDRGDIQRMLLASDQRRVRYVPIEVIEALEKECKEVGGLKPEIEGGLAFIYPGTKWCGPGSIAAEYNDVGRYAEEDRCCREHDLCPQTLSPGECKKGLCNQSVITRSHCDCDVKFRRCLQQLNTETANTLGAVFFNVVQVTCFKERPKCSTHQSSKSKCSYRFYKSESYISAPLLLALNSGQSKPHVYHVSNSENNARSIYSNAFNSPNNRVFSEETPRELEKSIRLASLGLAAKNIFHDMFVRRLVGFTRLLKLTTNILEN